MGTCVMVHRVHLWGYVGWSDCSRTRVAPFSNHIVLAAHYPVLIFRKVPEKRTRQPGRVAKKQQPSKYVLFFGASIHRSIHQVIDQFNFSLGSSQKKNKTLATRTWGRRLIPQRAWLLSLAKLFRCFACATACDETSRNFWWGVICVWIRSEDPK